MIKKTLPFILFSISGVCFSANNCPENLMYMVPRLTTEIKNSLGLREPIVNLIQKAGSASALVAIYTGQKQSYIESRKSALQSAQRFSSAGSNPIGHGLCPDGDQSLVCASIHGYYLADDGIKLSDATIEAAECYQNNGY